jgi:hypothetical protein
MVIRRWIISFFLLVLLDDILHAVGLDFANAQIDIFGPELWPIM